MTAGGWPAVTIEAWCSPAAGSSPRRSLFEWYNFLAGDGHSSDCPARVSPVLHAAATRLSQSLPEDRRQELKRYLPSGGSPSPLDGTASDGRDETRGYLALDWLLRRCAPAWLGQAGLTAAASGLRDLPRITSVADADDARAYTTEARSSASAAQHAAWDAVRTAGGATWAAEASLDGYYHYPGRHGTAEDPAGFPAARAAGHVWDTRAGWAIWYAAAAWAGAAGPEQAARTAGAIEVVRAAGAAWIAGFAGDIWDAWLPGTVEATEAVRRTAGDWSAEARYGAVASEAGKRAGAVVGAKLAPLVTGLQDDAIALLDVLITGE